MIKGSNVQSYANISVSLLHEFTCTLYLLDGFYVSTFGAFNVRFLSFQGERGYQGDKGEVVSINDKHSHSCIT